jgi:hypothetical protein
VHLQLYFLGVGDLDPYGFFAPSPLDFPAPLIHLIILLFKKQSPISRRLTTSGVFVFADLPLLREKRQEVMNRAKLSQACDLCKKFNNGINFELLN